MSSPDLTAFVPHGQRARSSLAARAPRLPTGWLREPLLHFVALGGALFALDRLVVARADDPHTIVVGAQVEREAIETFTAARGHAPDDQEKAALRRVWLDNEVLYREGLALGVDKGDSAIRERVIFKALSVVDSGVKLPPADDAVLRRWFDSHRDRYDEPTRYDFEEAALSGNSDEPTVRAFVDALNSGTPGDARAGLRVFKGRPEANLIQSYGPAFARELAAARPGQWRAFATRDGWRAMRPGGIAGAKPASFEALRGVILHDWTDATAAEQRTAAVRALARKYKIKHELPTGESVE
ncbi:MAG TPA: peptidylprolyl isomerase [Polyangia bacterium]|nr:peptidylprolyl isomerase [Polyangia bacterium]